MRNQTNAEEPISVLLVDDESSFANIMSKRLTRRGMSVRTAADGGEAYSLVESTPFDVVVLDVGLPDVCGMQLIKAIKLLSRKTEIILLTGGDTGSLESSKAGAFDLFGKPAEIDLLTRSIRDAARNAIS